MTVGRFARNVLGTRGSRLAGRAYRAIFADMQQAVRTIARQIPHGAHVLDVGGGDGAVVDGLLGLRHDIRVTTIDIAPVVGQWIDPAHEARTVRLPNTTLADYMASGRSDPGVLLMTDLMHHVPVAERHVLLDLVGVLLQRAPSLRIIVKDVEPGYLRSRLGYLSDRYVTGDRDVSPVSRSEVIAAMRRVDSRLSCTETALFARDKPNYALVFWRQA